MTSRRAFLGLLALTAAALSAPAAAFEIRPYNEAVAQKAIESGRPGSFTSMRRGACNATSRRPFSMA
jgi:hypothetical protein